MCLICQRETPGRTQDVSIKKYSHDCLTDDLLHSVKVFCKFCKCPLYHSRLYSFLFNYSEVFRTDNGLLHLRHWFRIYAKLISYLRQWRNSIFILQSEVRIRLHQASNASSTTSDVRHSKYENRLRNTKDDRCV